VYGVYGYMVYTEYTLYSMYLIEVLLPVKWEIAQINFDVIRNYIEVFDMDVWSIDFLRDVVYK